MKTKLSDSTIRENSLRHSTLSADETARKKEIGIIEMQDEDLALAREYADSHEFFKDSFLVSLEGQFHCRGKLTEHQWVVLQSIIEKFQMREWSNRGNV